MFGISLEKNPVGMLNYTTVTWGSLVVTVTTDLNAFSHAFLS